MLSRTSSTSMRSALKGFTLVEIIVVIAIMIVFLVVGTTGYTTQIRERQLKSDADQLVNELQRMHADTIARNIKDVDQCRETGGGFSGRTISFTIGSPDYEILLQCGLTTPFDREGTLNNSVVTSGPTITFTLPYGVTPVNRTIIIQHNSGSRCVRINVDSYKPITVTEPYDC